MIDTSRWLLVETWLSLGLRIEWSHAWDDDKDKDETREKRDHNTCRGGALARHGRERDDHRRSS